MGCDKGTECGPQLTAERKSGGQTTLIVAIPEDRGAGSCNGCWPRPARGRPQAGSACWTKSQGGAHRCLIHAPRMRSTQSKRGKQAVVVAYLLIISKILFVARRGAAEIESTILNFTQIQIL